MRGVHPEPEHCGCAKLARRAKARTLKRADLKKASFDVIINATPVGMGNTKDSPFKRK